MRLGVNVDPHNNPPAPALLAEMGFTWARFVARPDAATDTYAAACGDAGLTFLPILARETYGDRHRDEVLWDLGGLLERSDVIQVSNEPDLHSPASWTQTPAECAEHYNLVAWLYPQHGLILAGLASGDPRYLADTLPLLDRPPSGIGLHPYGQQPDGLLTTPMPWAFGLFHEMLLRYRRVTDIPIWLTELGDDGAHGEDFQAAWLVAMLRRCHALGVDHAALFCWHDGMVPGFGLTYDDGNPKPSYHALDAYLQEQTPMPDYSIGTGFQARIDELGLQPKSNETYFTPDLSLVLTDAGPLWYAKHTNEVLGPFPKP